MIYYFTGERVNTISDSAFGDVCQHTGSVYAALLGDPAIHVYDKTTLERIRTITACMSSGSHIFHTLRVTSHSITLACMQGDCIYILDNSGTLQKTHGENCDTTCTFREPCVCRLDSDGSMLVADKLNDRIQVFVEGEWRVLPLHPQPSRPVDAVVTQHALYVVNSCKKLIMYKID